MSVNSVSIIHKKRSLCPDDNHSKFHDDAGTVPLYVNMIWCYEAPSPEKNRFISWNEQNEITICNNHHNHILPVYSYMWFGVFPTIQAGLRGDNQGEHCNAMTFVSGFPIKNCITAWIMLVNCVFWGSESWEEEEKCIVICDSGSCSVLGFGKFISFSWIIIYLNLDGF